MSELLRVQLDFTKVIQVQKPIPGRLPYFEENPSIFFEGKFIRSGDDAFFWFNKGIQHREVFGYIQGNIRDFDAGWAWWKDFEEFNRGLERRAEQLSKKGQTLIPKYMEKSSLVLTRSSSTLDYTPDPVSRNRSVEVMTNLLPYYLVTASL